MSNIKTLLEPYSPSVLANACGVSQGFISHLRTGRKKPSPALAKRIETATNGNVTRWQLRPDVFDPPTETVSAGK
jgi:DNA-binding transcriptional regulator YdaS (Cro superfamily)